MGLILYISAGATTYMNLNIFHITGEIKPHLAPVPTDQNIATLTLKRAYIIYTYFTEMTKSL